MIGTAAPNAIPFIREYTEREHVVKKTLSSETSTKDAPQGIIISQTTTKKKIVIKTERTFFVVFGHSGSSIVDEREGQSIQSFLEHVYMLANSGFVRHAMDAVFQKMNALLTSGQFTIADKILSRVDIDRLPPTLLVGFLSITMASSKFLIERPTFYAKVYSRLNSERGPEAAARLLTKYAR